MDYILYLVDKFLRWTAEALEDLDAFLLERLGAQWWIGTPLNRFAPQGVSNGK